MEASSSTTFGGKGSLKVGKPNPVMDMCFEISICPDLLMAGIAAFAAGAFFFINQAIIDAAKRKRRRRKRGINFLSFTHLIQKGIAAVLLLRTYRTCY